jgi:NAD(P)-dependent dehydrogenase (short-subunit alcohol dehydrogenase family)
VNIRFDGRTAIVTGSAGGIGKAIARELAAAGAHGVIVDINLDAARATAVEIEKDFAVGALPVRCDITRQAQVDRMVARAVRQFGAVHVLVNNAGLSYPAHLVDMTDDQWNKMIAVNLTGTKNCGRAFIAQLLRQKSGGVVINISSKSGVHGSADMSHYCATKFGVIGLAQSWAREYAKQGIRCCSVLPGNVFEGSAIWNKEFIARTAKKLGIPPDQVRAFYDRQVPLGRACTPQDVAHAVAFLASDQASYITGVHLLVDGGQEMR